jgi:hypothetical protein
MNQEHITSHTPDEFHKEPRKVRQMQRTGDDNPISPSPSKLLAKSFIVEANSIGSLA